MFGMSAVLIQISGTNIEGTILLVKVVRVANLPDDSNRAAHVALGIASSAWAMRQVFCSRHGRRAKEADSGCVEWAGREENVVEKKERVA